jgi:hypothetical protein
MEQRTASAGRSSMLGSGPDRPVPIGVPVKTTIQHGGRIPSPEIFNIEIALLDATRGSEALNRIKAGGRLPVPRPGFEYILARIRFGFFAKMRGPLVPPPYVIDRETFGAASGDGKMEYALPPLLQHFEPQLIGMPFSVGDSREGSIVLEVPESERKPLLVFHRAPPASSYGVWASIWFRLYSIDPTCIGDCRGECR